ncbi:hypothetical protein ABZ927_05395 [Streptomyces massasporeus]
MPAPSLQVSRPHIPARVALPPRDRRPGRARADHWVLSAALFAAYTVVSVGRYRHLAGLSWDLGIFEQVVRAYAQLRAPVADLKGPGFIILGHHRLLARIPDDATIEANIGPISRLTSRCRVFWLGDTQGVTPEYIALENVGDQYRDPVGYARKLHPLAEYDVAGETGGYVLLQRRTAAGG